MPMSHATKARTEQPYGREPPGPGKRADLSRRDGGPPIRGTRARVRRAAAHRPSKTTTSTPRPDSEGTHLLTTAAEWGHADAAGSPSTASPLHFDRHWPADAGRLFAIDAGAQALAQGKVAGRALVVARDICESGRCSSAGGWGCRGGRWARRQA